MSGVALLRMLDVLKGSVGLGAARSLRSGGAGAETASAMPGPSSLLLKSPRLSSDTEASKARSADACTPQPGARKEHPKAMAMRSASQQSHIYFRRLVCNCGYLLLCLPLRRFRDFVLTAFSSRRCRLFPGVCRGFPHGAMH